MERNCPKLGLDFLHFLVTLEVMELSALPFLKEDNILHKP